jgi:precorrin-2/cobalt-factor-2 C20-methyltransferase
MNDSSPGAPTSAPEAGTLYGIGLGPGDPELITVKGLRLLRAADVVFLPVRRAGAPSYAGSIAADYLDPARQAIVPLVYPAGRGANATVRWNANADEIAACLQGGGMGVFLTEGDPLLYSTFVHALMPLRERHPGLAVRVVPGVWSGSAAAAQLAEPLADGDERLAVLPATYALRDLPDVLRRFDTVVLLKPGDDVRALRAALAEAAATAVWVERIGRPEERIVRDLDAWPDERRDYFSLIIARSDRHPRTANDLPKEAVHS